MVNHDERLQLAKDWLREAASIAVVGFTGPYRNPGQLMMVVGVHAPYDGLLPKEMADEMPDWKVLMDNFAIGDSEFFQESEECFLDILKIRWTACMISMWEKATEANRKHNVRLLGKKALKLR